MPARQVVVLDDLSTGFRWAVPPEAVFVAGDAGDQALVARLIDAHGIDGILHFAARIVVPESVADPLSYYHNNTVKSRALIETAVKKGVKNFIFSSTAAVYGNGNGRPAAPRTSPLAPINPYGRSKLMTEWMLADAARAHDLRYFVLRYFNVAGADPQGPDGPVHTRGHPSHQGGGPGGPRAAAASRRLRHRLPDARRHLHPRLRAGERSRPRAPGGPQASARGRRQHDDELRLRPRRLGARGGRGGEARLGRRFRGPPAARRPGDPATLVAKVDRIRNLGWAPRHDNLDEIVGQALRWERQLGDRKTA